MKGTLGCVSLLVAMGVAGGAWAAAPSWCSAVGKERIDAHGDLKDMSERDDPRWVIPALVAATCTPDQEQQGQQKEIAALRDKWSQKLDMSDADWVDAVGYATQDRYSFNSDVRINTGGQELGIGHSLKRAWSAFDAIDQWVMLSADSGASGDMALDKNYLADALGAKLTEVGRAAYVRKCVEGSRDKQVQWAMCQGDIAQLDWKKLAEELRANKAYSGADKLKVRLALLELKAKLPEHAAKVKKLIASDPGWAKVFEAADKGRKEAEARATKDAAFIEAAAAMEDARALNSRKAFAGCEEKTWAVWKQAVATVAAKKYDGIRDDRENGRSFLDLAMGPIIGNPEAYLASVAYTLCMNADRDARKDVLLRSLGDAMSRWPGFRGPRTSANTAIMQAGIEFDDRDTKLDYPDVTRSFGGGGGSHGGGGIGVIGAIKAAGKAVTVTFKKQMVKQVQCAQVKYTRRVTQILNDGTLVYEHYCTKNETVIVDKSDAPQTVQAKYMEGVRPGMFFSNIEDVVLAVWAKPGAATPSMVFGVALK